MNPHLTACLAVLEEMYDGMVALIRPLDAECLNWTPSIPETNSIAALVRHTMGSLEGWFARAVGEPVQRNREAEFRARHTADELIALIEQSRAESRRRLAMLDGVDLSALRRYRRINATEDEDLSVAWCVEHAIIHAGEHWGQIQLNRQLYAANR